MTDIMLDIETLGTQPGCIILTIARNKLASQKGPDHG